MKEYIQKIVLNGNQNDMECLSEIMVEMLYDLKETNYDKFTKYKNKIKGMAYDYKIDGELAMEIVENMRPYGEVWSMETIQSVIGNDNHRLEDMYVVMNSLANDYSDIINVEEAETYVKMARAWIDDADAHKNKIWWYFVS